ncbi:DUF4340 domain-containing protein [Bacteroidia bacterium]|nr:DUF4340 domain-containing protein [Bacteroidia bacterium]MDB4107247.1 DUF4340 domain-containing protein [Bacteroidia bacterium]MDB9883319.1 DUF4340 domain-containing protein [Bacteroidia bacterium]
MKRYFWIIGIVALTALSYFIYTKDNGEANLRGEINFAIDDVNDVDRILLKNRLGNIVLLEKREDIWYVNNKYKAFAPVVKIFLEETLSKIRIKGPVAKPARQNVIRGMVGHSIHVIISANGNEIRNYYVGNANADQSGSYLHIDGSDIPYVAHILGFNGIINPKFSTDVQDWCDKSVFDYKPGEMAKITVVNNEIPSESFSLSRSSDSLYALSPTTSNLSQSAARSYFALFSFKNFEGYADYLTQESKDSIKNTIPFMSIEVELKNGDKQKLNIHRKKGISDVNTLVDKNGNVLVDDTERYFATFTSFDKLVTIQDYTFGKLIVKRSFFGQKP